MKVTKTERLGNGILLVTVPVTFKWRNTGNGPVIINPDSSIVDLRRETILTAVARGRRWVQLLDDGSVESIRAIAAKIGREPNYVARLIRLSMLAPLHHRERHPGRLPCQHLGQQYPQVRARPMEGPGDGTDEVRPQ